MIKKVFLRAGTILFLVESALSGPSCTDSELSLPCPSRLLSCSHCFCFQHLCLAVSFCEATCAAILPPLGLYLFFKKIIETFYVLSTKSSDIQTVYNVRNHNAYMIIENIRGTDPRELSRTVQVAVSTQCWLVLQLLVIISKGHIHTLNKVNNYLNTVLKLVVIQRQM